MSFSYAKRADPCRKKSAKESNSHLDRDFLRSRRSPISAHILQIYAADDRVNFHWASDPASSGDVPDTTVSFTDELRKLKNRLACECHNGQHCYINKVNGEHEFQDIYKLTFWAKSIVRVIFPPQIYVLTISKALRQCDL